MLKAIESGWVQREISREAYRFQREIESGKRVIVGVNRYVTDKAAPFRLHRIDPHVVERVKENLKSLRRERDASAVESALSRLKGAARGDENLMPMVMEAVKSYATVGEICDALRDVFGEYKPPSL